MNPQANYSPQNIFKMMDDFDTDTECRAYLEALRWSDGVVRCPRCQSDKISRIRERKQFDCDGCRYQFSVTAGTIFHDSHLGLPKWFLAIYLLCEAKKSMSALQLKRTMGVSYKTAWYMCHRIREAMKTEHAPMLGGTVEVDETYIGGEIRGRRNRYKNKTVVLGARQRGGMLRIRTAGTNSRKELHGFIRENVTPDVQRIMTDEWAAYQGIATPTTSHETVTHSAGEYVRADVHTNTVESAFSLFKRAIAGSFHQISAKHLDRYLDEFEFRFNNRENKFLFRDTVKRLIDGKAMPYEKLTA